MSDRHLARFVNRARPALRQAAVAVRPGRRVRSGAFT